MPSQEREANFLLIKIKKQINKTKSLKKEEEEEEEVKFKSVGISYDPKRLRTLCIIELVLLYQQHSTTLNQKKL